MARPSKQHEIEIWLRGLLSAGRRKADEVLTAGQNAGYPPRTLRRAKADLGIVSEKGDGLWYWRDPNVIDKKPQTEDKLDVLLHEVKETQRLAQAPASVQNTEQSNDWLASRKSKPYDPQDPKNKAIAEQLKRLQERAEAVRGVVKSIDPFGLLDSADLDEVKEMLLLVRNYQSGFEPEKPDEDDLAEMGKWDEWIDRAKKRVKQLEHDLAGVLAT
jgi:hypothetical protein